MDESAEDYSGADGYDHTRRLSHWVPHPPIQRADEVPTISENIE
jgi:hypothetical protein